LKLIAKTSGVHGKFYRAGDIEDSHVLEARCGFVPEWFEPVDKVDVEKEEGLPADTSLGKMTVLELQNLLQAKSVPFAASAKKADLVALVEEHVAGKKTNPDGGGLEQVF